MHTDFTSTATATEQQFDDLPNRSGLYPDDLTATERATFDGDARDLFEMREALKRDVERRQAQISEIDQALQKLIPANGFVDGIKHTVADRQSVSWKNANRRIVALLVPKTRHDAAQDIVDNETKVVAYHRIYEPKS